MGKLTVRALRAVIVVLLAGSLFVQTVMVALLAIDLKELGDLAGYQRVSILVIMVLGIVTAQVILVCVWKLVTMVRRETVFSRDAFRYVDVMIGAIVAAAVLTLALGAVLAPGEAAAPGVVLMIGGVAVAIFGVALVLLVLRMLLAQAARMRAELAEVI
ncbi:DUF2975 family protein [Herbihabitans rhizosphaerae]|uniref:DUF2975 family protein n=2 Tax=Herbihabitans rhizosphaerae TaxID=1872711 RepID=A0A4Q7KP81_9PSEU|nr:DUF2975 family protein [Herbihabitans rhizosphaerae]